MALDPISTSNLDADVDSPKLARVQLLQSIQLLNQLIGDVRIGFSQDPIVLPVDESGSPDYSGASSQVRVFRFVQDETADWAFSIFAIDCTAAIVGTTVTVTAADKDVSYCEVTATRAGYPNVVRRLTIFRNASMATPSAPDNTPPPTPTGVVFFGGINHIQGQWDTPVYLYGRGNGQTNIYGAIWDKVSAKPTFNSVGTKLRWSVLGTNNVGSFPSDPATYWCLWLKFQSKDGVESVLPAGPTNGYEVETGQDPAKLLAILNNQITQSELNLTLSTKIDLITANSSVPGSVNARILAEQTAREDALALEVSDRNTAIGTEVSNRTAAINALNAVKTRVFYSANPPSSDVNYTLVVNDTWFDTDDSNKEYRWNGSTWVPGGDLRLATLVTDFSNEVTQRANADLAEVYARTSLYTGVSAGQGNDYKIFNQPGPAPVGTTVGDVWSWVDTAGNVTFSRWNGTVWVDSVANRRAATYRGSYPTQTEINALTGSVIGDLAQRNSDNAVVVWNGSSWAIQTAPASQVYAFLQQEAVSRTTNDATEAANRLTLATQMRGAYTGSDITALSSGLLYEERQARSTADASEVTARQTLSTAILGATSPAGLNLGNLSAGLIFDERTARSTAISSETSSRQLLSTKVLGVSDPTSATLANLSSGIIFDEKTARSTADASEVTARQSLSTKLTGAADPTSLTLATLSTGLIFDERTARSTAISSEASSRQLLSTKLLGVADPTSATLGNVSSGIIFDERTARSSADSAQVSRLDALEASLTVGGTTYLSIASVATTAASKSANFVQSSAPTATRLNDTWLDTSNGRVLKRWDGAAWVLADDTRIGTTASQVTTLQSSIQDGPLAVFESAYQWDFSSSVEGWTFSGATSSVSGDALTLASTSSDPIAFSPAVSFSGAKYDKVRARVKRNAGSGWNGYCLYSTTLHGQNGASYLKIIPDTTVIGTWVILEWDMAALDIGGTDWITSTITALRLDFGATPSDSFTIDWIAVGKRASGASYATVQQEISTRASETGHLAASYAVRTQVTSGGRTVMGGFGIMGTSGGSAGPTIDFGIQADRFWIGAPSANAGISDVQPFIVKTTNSTDPTTGVFIPKGVYMDSAFITNLTALWGNFGTLIADSIRATSISTAQLTLGDGTVGGDLKSSNFSPGSGASPGVGWKAQPNGSFFLNNATVYGTIHASSGTFAGSLSAATGTVGTLTIASGGHIKLGQTAYNTGTGIWAGDVAGVPKLSIGIAGGPSFRWDGSNVVLNQATFDSFTASIPAGDLNAGVVNGGFATYGSRSVTLSGGRAPFSYLWVTNSAANVYIEGSPVGSTVSIGGYGDGGNTSGYVTCFVTDANGRTTMATIVAGAVHNLVQPGGG